MLITLMGMTLVILNLGARTLLAETQRSYFEACDRNLTAGGLAWANYMAAQQQSEWPTQPLELNIESMQIPQGNLTISFTDPNAAGVTVKITTTCGRNELLLQRTRRYFIK